MAKDEVLLETKLPIPLVGRGKVRDIYDLGDQLLFIATDRISAFDCILPTGIPEKGRVLTQMSVYWFEFLRDLVPNHLTTTDLEAYPATLKPFGAALEGRSMLVKRARMVEVECVARGYLAGSGWKEYRESGRVCGIPLPAGLRDGDRLPEPIFTPATKAQSGHDMNVPFEHVADLVGSDLAHQLRALTLSIYEKAADYAISARHHPGRHEVRIWICGRHAGSGRRSFYAGLFPLVAGGHLRSGRPAGLVRQAICSRLSRNPRVEQTATRASAAGRSRRENQRKIH